MLIQEKVGNLREFDAGSRMIDRLPLHWYETGKRILHKQTGSGKNVVMKFLNANPELNQDDVVFADERSLIVIEIMYCDAIVVRPASLYEMAFVCYEIGNKQLLLFYENVIVLIPYDAPLFSLLKTTCISFIQEKIKLLHPLKTTVSPHGHDNTGSGLFSKILQRTKTVSRNAD